jgi:4-amino-4-deoxy-L-arabinose transferase-like glycosyltransferase
MSRILKTIYQSREWLLLCLVVFFAYCLRIFCIKRGLPYCWHGDEINLMHTTFKILKTGDYNPHFFNYPTLIIYCQTLNAIFCYFYAIKNSLLVSLNEILTNANEYERWWWTISHPVFWEWGRRLTVVFGTLSVGIVYIICSRYYSSLLAALLASFFLACNLPHINLSAWVLVDVPTAFFILATALSSSLLLIKGERRHYVITGLLAGLSVAAKYNSWTIIVLPLLGHLLNKNKSDLFSVNVLFLFVTIPLGFLLGCPYAIGDLPAFLKDAGWEVFHYTNYGEKTTLLQQVVFYYHGFCEDRWAMGGGGGVGTFMLYSAFLGMISGFFVNWRVHILLLSYPIAFLLYMSTMQLNYMRNMTAVNAFLLIFAGLFISQTINFVFKFIKKLNISYIYKKIIFVVLIIAFLISPFYKALKLSVDSYKARDSRVLTVEWLAKNVKQPEKVAFVNELRWFRPDLDKLNFEHILIGQLEKEPVWYWNEGFDYIVVARKYWTSPDEPNLQLSKYEKSFLNMTIVQSIGTGWLPARTLPVDPEVNILKVDSRFCESKYWDNNSDDFEFKLHEFKGGSNIKNYLWDETSKQSWWRVHADFCSPRVVFEEGNYEVEITASGSSATGVFPLMKLEALKWKDEMQATNEILGEWPVEKEKTMRSGVFHCNKGDAISFNVIFSNKKSLSTGKEDTQLNIKKIIVKKSDVFHPSPK